MKLILLAFMLIVPAGYTGSVPAGFTGGFADSFADGVRAYREQDYEQSFAAFMEAERDAGEHASAALFYNKALAALRIGELELAQAAAESARERGNDQVRALAQFLMGNIALVYCRQAEFQASKPDAVAADYDRAIAFGELAKRTWIDAAMEDADWPAARRNVERALLKLAELRDLRTAAANNLTRKLPAKPKPKLTPLPQPPQGPQTSDSGDPIQMSPEQIQKLLSELDSQERDKQESRKARRSHRVVVEKDW